MKERIGDALKERFKPEFLNRLDEVIIFHKLTKEDASKICDKILEGLQKRLKEQGIHIRVTSRARELITEKGYSEEFGARPLKRTVQKLVEDKLSEEILLQHIAVGRNVVIDEEDGQLVFSEE